MDELTQEQRDKLPIYRDKWRDYGVNTDTIDQEAALRAVGRLYADSGNAMPEHHRFFRSPREAAHFGGYMMAWSSKVGDENFLKDVPLYIAKAEAVFQDGEGDYRQRMLDEFSDLQSHIRTATHELVYGGHDAIWCAFHDFFQQEVGESKDATGFIECGKHTGWVFTYNCFVGICDRPRIINFDDEDRLHNEHDWAVGFRDGWGIAMWHGTRIPDEWISDPNQPTVQDAISHENAELRRCAAEMLGWDKVLTELKARVIHEDPDPNIGTLLEVDLPEIGTERFLRVLCGTNRQFAMPVPPDIQTAMQAQAWMVGLDESDFVIPEVRT